MNKRGFVQLNLNSFCTTEYCDNGRITVELPELVELTWTKKKNRETLAIILERQHNAGGIYWSLRLRNPPLLEEKVHKAVGISASSDPGEGFLHGWWQGP